MLYVMYGTDIDKVREQTRLLVDALLEKKPDSNMFRVTPETISEDVLKDKISGQGLFEKRYIIVLDSVCSDKNTREIFIDNIADIASSENIFVLEEESLTKAVLKKLEKHALKIKEYSKQIEKKKAPTLFPLTDAFAQKDAQGAWVEYQKALSRGVSPEEIHSMLLWQIKSMIQSGKAQTPNGAGLKPFVYNKSKRALGKFGEESIQSVYTDLSNTYHEARRRLLNLEEGIEEVILSI